VAGVRKLAVCGCEGLCWQYGLWGVWVQGMDGLTLIF